MRLLLLPLLLLFFYSGTIQAQTIMGDLEDNDTHQPLSNVQIQNIYNNAGVMTDKSGRFVIAATGGQLITFKKEGYKSASVRIPQGPTAPYFKILLQHGPSDSTERYVANDWRTDSMKSYDLWKHELEFPRMNSIEMIEHPFSALSSHNREIWAFQDKYEDVQQQKYIDYRFNKDVISRLTGLTGDSLDNYLRRYRPSYFMARTMNDYNLYQYIKRTMVHYRNGTYDRFSR